MATCDGTVTAAMKHDLDPTARHAVRRHPQAGRDADLARLDREQRARASRLRQKRAQDILCLTGASAGMLILLAACLYRRLRHPEWTGGQAVEALWPLYLAGASSICLGWLFSDAGRE